MKISTLGRHFREGGKSVVRNGWMSFASISSITISLLILGMFLILGMNVDYLSRQVENQVTIRVFLELGTPQETRMELQDAIAAMPETKKVTFVPKEEALEMMKKRLGDTLEGLEGANNPLNDSFTVEVNNPREVDAASAKISALNEGRSPQPVWKVDYGKGTVDNLFKVTKVLRYIGLFFVISLVFTSMFLISNTIKLTILARNREIRIMKLVGATNGFIRWPFFVEGALIGFVGALIPTLLLGYGYSWWVDYSSTTLGMLMLEMMPYREVTYPMAAVLMGIGLSIGIWGSLISVRKFLKV